MKVNFTKKEIEVLLDMLGRISVPLTDDSAEVKISIFNKLKSELEKVEVKKDGK